MQSVSHPPQSVNARIYPTLAHAFIKQEHVPPSRVWLLLRTLDSTGKGWVDIETAKRHLTHNRSPLRLCGWRRLRQILAQGEGTFWTNQNRRLWLYGAGRVAQELGVSKLVGRPVLIPLSALTTDLKTYRAHLYTTFHTSRPKDANPISRQSLTKITGASPRAQRTYDRHLRTHRTTNYTEIAHHDPSTKQELSYEHGFIFKQKNHWVRQIGNQYVVNAQIKAANGRKKKINRQLKKNVGQLAKLPFAYRRNCAVPVTCASPNLLTQTQKTPSRSADLVTSRAQGNGLSTLGASEGVDHRRWAIDDKETPQAQIESESPSPLSDTPPRFSSDVNRAFIQNLRGF